MSPRLQGEQCCTSGPLPVAIQAEQLQALKAAFPYDKMPEAYSAIVVHF